MYIFFLRWLRGQLIPRTYNERNHHNGIYSMHIKLIKSMGLLYIGQITI